MVSKTDVKAEPLGVRVAHEKDARQRGVRLLEQRV